MGRVIYKPEKDVDFYVVFSTISDSPIFAGTAREFLGLVVADQFAGKFEQSGLTSDYSVENLKLADECGSSSRGRFQTWDGDEDINWGGLGTVKLSQLAQICELYDFETENVEDKKIVKKFVKKWDFA